METKHTKGPLHIDQYCHIYGEARRPESGEEMPGMPKDAVYLIEPHIATVHGKGAKPGDGSRLVRCWNAHEALVEAVETTLAIVSGKSMEHIVINHPNTPQRTLGDVLRDALNIAEEKHRG